MLPGLGLCPAILYPLVLALPGAGTLFLPNFCQVCYTLSMENTAPNQKRLLSGIKPTGRPHLGNYLGALRQFVEFQNEYETFVMVADLHALTTVQDAKDLRYLTRELVLDYLGSGLDPERVTIFRQSDVPQHAELAWVFECITTMPYLMRAHAFKDAEAKNKDINVGTFNYPMLMAADILLYDADVVPVGQDQKQHIEFARDTAEKFNRTWENEVFKTPEPLIQEAVATVPGVDGQKMSKSYHNTIPLFATDTEIAEAVMSIVTGSNPKGSPNDPGDTLFTILSFFLEEDELHYRRGIYESGEMGYKDTKELLIENLREFIEPMRERREVYETNPERVDAILAAGAVRAGEVAAAKMTEVKKAIGLL